MKIVPPDGDPASRIAIIGARPGSEEASEGRSFVGPSGRLLWALLSKMGVSREDCYVTNVRKDPSATDTMPTRPEIAEALPDLQRELNGTRNNIIIALGAQALYALTELGSIENWRGSILQSSLISNRKVLAAWHPAACLRTYHWTYVLEHDLRKACRESHFPDIKRPIRNFTLAPSFPDCLAYLDSLADPISLDIETFGDQPSCVGLSDSPSRAICIPFIGSHYTVSELSTIWRKLASVLRTRRIIGQNIQFDTTRLERWGFRLPNLFFDTMLAHHLLWPELGGATKRASTTKRGLEDLAGKHSLAFLVSIYTDEPYYKDEGGFSGDWERYWTYNCKDAACTYECYLGLERELEKYDQSQYFQKEVMGLIRTVMSLQSRGLCVDFPTLNATRQRMELETKYLQLRFNQRVGFECNVKSPIDLAFLIHDQLRLPHLKRTKTGKPSTDEDTILQLAYNSPHAALFKEILDIRERRTLCSSFLSLETGTEGRYQANYLMHGADNGRFSSQAARKGPQLQNIPLATRKVFIASPGCVLIQGDYRRAEAHFVAYDSCDEGLIQLFEGGSDIYASEATATLGYAVTKATHPLERRCFKQVVLAGYYGMGPKKFVIVCRLNGIDLADITVRGIPSRERKAEYFLGAQNARYPGIARWQKAIRDDVSRSRTLWNPHGRRRIFLGRMDDHLFRVAYAWRPSSTVVGNTNRALRVLWERPEFTVLYWLLLQVHDSIVIECPADRVGDGIAALRTAMHQPVTLHGRTLTIPIDVQVGLNWGPYHEEHNPNGLQEWKGEEAAS